MKKTKGMAQPIQKNVGPPKKMPDFLARLRAIYGDKVLAVSGAKLLKKDQSRN